MVLCKMETEYNWEMSMTLRISLTILALSVLILGLIGIYYFGKWILPL